MKAKLLLLVFALGLSTSAWAGTCGSASMSVYDTAGFSCTIGNLLFSNFSSVATPSWAPNAVVSVTPETTGPEQGLEFSAAWQAGGTQTEDLLIKYTVSCANDTNCITDLALSMVGDSVGSGSATVVEKYTGGTLMVYNFDVNGVSDAWKTFDPAVASLSVSKDIGVSGGGDGVAAISDVFNGISTTTTTPEPASMMLLGTFLSMAGGLLSRKKRA